MQTFSLNQTNQIIELYLNGNSVLSISNKFNRSTCSIQKILNDNNISKISQAIRNNPSFKERYFEILDDKYKAYWIGFILADGGIAKNGLEISLQKRDKYLLELLESDLQIYNHVKPFNKDYFRLTIGSKIMCNDLSQYGIVPNKTLSLKFPTNIPEEYEIDLLRGMFDGDGGFTIGVTTRFYKDRNKSYTKPYRELSFTGTYDMCVGFQNTLLKYVDISIKNIKKNNSIYRVRWSNKDEILKILDLFYMNSGNHYLKRKYDLYTKLKN